MSYEQFPFLNSCRSSKFECTDDAVNISSKCFNNLTEEQECSPFCSRFDSTVPHVFLAFSCLSAFCCVWVFVTYFIFPRLSGYSSKVFLFRTTVDLLIAVGHIIAFIFKLPESRTVEQVAGCAILGTFNEFALVASNLWYTLLAWDLIKAIRNPFSAHPSYGWTSHVVVWGVSILAAAVLALIPRGPGLSMFYWCWVSIRESTALHSTDSLDRYIAVTFFLYYLPHFLLFLFSFVVLIIACCILWGHFVSSSDTRKFVMKQNAAYVLVLGIETFLIIPIWIAQLVVLRERCSNTAYFLTNTDLVVAALFATIHSLRGTVDLVVWWVTFSIGPKDFKDLYHKIRRRWKKNLYLPEDGLNQPLISKGDSIVNRSLRRDAIYCINVGILDAVKLNAHHESRKAKLGSVRDSFVAQAMVQWDAENQQQHTADLHEDPLYREQSERKIQFPASASLQKFAFIDVEPSIFSLLRNAYSIGPRLYRQSFKIKNAADIESSGMLEKFTEGKSGSFFYFTRDFRYIIKTVTDSEERFLQKIAYRYYSHMRNHPNSLIVRFFGLHKVRLAPEQRYIAVVVMENIFYNHDQKKIHERYDLKGSTVGRRVLKGGKVRGKHAGTLKDLDLNQRVVIGPERTQLMEQLQQDVEFLTSLKIMDYSMLLGIHHHSQVEASAAPPHDNSVEVDGGDNFVDVSLRLSKGPCSTPPGTIERQREMGGPVFRRPSRTISLLSDVPSGSSLEDSEGNIEPHIPWFRRDFGGLRSYSPFHPCHPCSETDRQESEQDGGLIQGYLDLDAQSLPVATYYFGIVDILQEYNLKKRIEHLWKTQVMCQNKHRLSAVNEKEYGQRFLSAMDRIFE